MNDTPRTTPPPERWRKCGTVAVDGAPDALTLYEYVGDADATADAEHDGMDRIAPFSGCCWFKVSDLDQSRHPAMSDGKWDHLSRGRFQHARTSAEIAVRYLVDNRLADPADTLSDDEAGQLRQQLLKEIDEAFDRWVDTGLGRGRPV